MRATIDGTGASLATTARALAARVEALHPPADHLEGWWSPAARCYADRAQELRRCLVELRHALDELAVDLAAGR